MCGQLQLHPASPLLTSDKLRRRRSCRRSRSVPFSVLQLQWQCASRVLSESPPCSLHPLHTNLMSDVPRRSSTTRHAHGLDSDEEVVSTINTRYRPYSLILLRSIYTTSIRSRQLTITAHMHCARDARISHASTMMRCSTPQTHPHPAMHPAQVPPRPRTAPDHRAAAATRAGTWIEHPIDAGSRMHPELYISSCTVNIPRTISGGSPWAWPSRVYARRCVSPTPRRG
jgi:hypothetical protein